MNMNEGVKNLVVLGLSLLVAFFGLYSVLYFYGNGLIIPISAENEFYLQKFDPSEKKVFLIGNSFAARLNGTIIQSEIDALGYDNHVFYNLGMSADTPAKRQGSLDYIIISKPEIVFYAVSMDDLGFALQKTTIKNIPTAQREEPLGNTNEEQFFDPATLAENFIASQPFLNSFTKLPNPKLVSLTLLKTITDGYEEIVLYPKYSDKPFYRGTKDATIIKSDEELMKDFPKHEIRDLSGYKINKEKMRGLENIITTLQQNQIKIVFYVPPFSKIFLDRGSDQVKQEFYSKLDSLSKEYSVKVYNFLEEYQDMKIWSKSNHVAIHPNSDIVSQDFAKVVLEEIRDICVTDSGDTLVKNCD